MQHVKRKRIIKHMLPPEVIDRLIAFLFCLISIPMMSSLESLYQLIIGLELFLFYVKDYPRLSKEEDNHRQPLVKMK